MSKHTPGPWIVSGNNPRTVKHASGPVLADCGPVNAAEAHANARLIAAAPDLLAALIDAVSSLEFAAPIIEAPEKSAYRESISAAHAAIAKATAGGSHE